VDIWAVIWPKGFHVIHLPGTVNDLLGVGRPLFGITVAIFEF
jgi:hypothetical protein